MNYRIEEFRQVETHEDLPEHIVPGIEQCVSKAFGGGITPEDARAHMSGTQILVAQPPEDNQVIGFTSIFVSNPAQMFEDERLPDRNALYFAGAAIDASVQGNGLYSVLNRRRLGLLDEHDLDIVYTRTQNPRVQEGITHSLDKLIAEGRCSAYDVGRLIVPGAYGKMLTAQKPSSRKVVYDDLDYEKGDAAIIVWSLTR
jgi:hypothetical protein